MKLFHGRAEWYLRDCDPVRTVFMDPPDNLGLTYDNYYDNIEHSVYYYWLRGLVSTAMKKAEVVWLSYHSKHDLQISAMLLNALSPSWTTKKVIWRYTFGQYNANDFASGYRPILRISRDGVKFNTEAVLVTSRRQELGDPRAAGPRLPDDVWEYPRIVGNSPERRAWHPTQHPIDLYRRIADFSGYPFVDLFAGTGTCFRMGRDQVHGVEQSALYCSKIREEHQGLEFEELQR